MQNWTIEPLTPTHRRSEFACGNESLDQFIRTLVSQYERRNLGRTYVAVGSDRKRVLGYYTLAAGAVAFRNLPLRAAHKLPKHPIPVALLGRLAVDARCQGQGLGKLLLADALRRCLALSSDLGLHAVEVHAIDETARRFYEHHAFAALEDDHRHLYLPVTTIRSAFES